MRISAARPSCAREFTLDTGHGEVVEAVLHATARGVFTVTINGQPVSDDVLRRYAR
jgi:alpha-L-rhamnosidase